jgi:hypothetical protein
MTELIEQHKNEIHKIAVNIDQLISVNPLVKLQFTKQIDNFCKMTLDSKHYLRLTRQILYRQGATNKKEMLMCDYVLLSIIHDCMMRTPSDKLFSTTTMGEWPNRLDLFYKEVCKIFCYEKHAILAVGDEPKEVDIRNLEEKKSQICIAFEHVKADLAKLKPEEKKQSAASAKGGLIGIFFWKLYEKTLKGVVDSVLEKMWPK